MKPISFGKYTLLHRIDTGGMAEVFRAKAFGVEGFERIVAVKRILPNIAADHDFITMFIDEAKLAVQLTHANIAQIFDLGCVGDSYFIALEYVHGKDLRAIFEHARARRTHLPLELVCYVMMKICEGLDYAHEKRDTSGRPLELVHRDVSPQNMLISFEGDVKLIDFGIAKAANKASRTRTGILKGKFGYLSPEQVRGEAVDRRSDLFGVGIVLYELLTNERLFVSDSEFSTIEKVRNAEIVPPNELNPALPFELVDIVMRALARDPDDRYATALELHDALQQFLHARGVPFHRKELSAWMLGQFPADAARDLEQVGDLEGAEALAFQTSDVARSVQPTESSAVYKETRDAPEEAKAKHPSTILGMPAVLPPADLAIPTPGGRPSLPPPPPRSGTNPPRPPGVRTAPPAPPRSPVSQHPSLPAPISPANLAASRNAPPPAPGGAPGQGAMLSMDWDDEELSTQIYDRPQDDYESIEGGFDEVQGGARGYGDDGLGFGDHEETSFDARAPNFDAFAPAGQPHSPHGVQVSPRAFADSSPPAQHVEPLSSLRAPTVNETMTTTAERVAERRNPLFPALAVAAVVLLCFVGYVFLARPPHGIVQLTTHPGDAEVMFDGKPVGTMSPYLITSVMPKEKHTIEVKKDGYRTWSQEVYLEPGQQLSFPVTLQPENGAAVGATTSAQVGGFSVETSPPGAAVSLDGQDLPGVTPLRVGNLLPRGYDLKVKLANFREYTTRVEVRAGVDRSLPRIALEAERVRVRIASEPSGADAALVRGRERRALGKTPIDVTIENDGNPWTLELTKPGYETFTQAVSPEAGAAEASVRAVLARKGQEVATAPSAEAPRAAAAEPRAASPEPRAPSPAPRASAPEAPRAPSSAPARAAPTAAASSEPAASGGQGTLRINSRPWSQVFVNGRNIGNTPQMNVSLPAGTHRIQLVNPEFNLRKTISVTIKPGQTETQIIALQ